MSSAPPQWRAAAVRKPEAGRRKFAWDEEPQRLDCGRPAYRNDRPGGLEGKGEMVARIYKPARTAMQSGDAKTKYWVLDYEPDAPRSVEPLMGWTSSSDMKSQVRLKFATREEAVAYCDKHGIPYQLLEPKEPARRTMAYADNFAFTRRGMWTH